MNTESEFLKLLDEDLTKCSKIPESVFERIESIKYKAKLAKSNSCTDEGRRR